jgi:hypothetical protein
MVQLGSPGDGHNFEIRESSSEYIQIHCDTFSQGTFVRHSNSRKYMPEQDLFLVS